MITHRAGALKRKSLTPAGLFAWESGTWEVRTAGEGDAVLLRVEDGVPVESLPLREMLSVDGRRAVASRFDLHMRSGIVWSFLASSKEDASGWVSAVASSVNAGSQEPAAVPTPMEELATSAAAAGCTATKSLPAAHALLVSNASPPWKRCGAPVT